MRILVTINATAREGFAEKNARMLMNPFRPLQQVGGGECVEVKQFIAADPKLLASSWGGGDPLGLPLLAATQSYCNLKVMESSSNPKKEREEEESAAPGLQRDYL